VLPNSYPLTGDVESYIANEQRRGRMLDYFVIVPRPLDIAVGHLRAAIRNALILLPTVFAQGMVRGGQ
jgi:hypothetical protein